MRILHELRSRTITLASALKANIFRKMVLIGTGLLLAACAPSQFIPGDSYTRANSSLAVQSWEASAVLALASVPSCDKHDLINTEVMSVKKALKIEGTRAIQGTWVEKWTYDICGTTVPVRVKYAVDELGTGYQTSLW